MHLFGDSNKFMSRRAIVICNYSLYFLVVLNVLVLSYSPFMDDLIYQRYGLVGSLKYYVFSLNYGLIIQMFVLGALILTGGIRLLVSRKQDGKLSEWKLNLGCLSRIFGKIIWNSPYIFPHKRWCMELHKKFK